MPNNIQTHFRIRIDGTAAQGGTPLWAAAEDTNINWFLTNTPFRIRFCIDSPTLTSGNFTWDIRVSRNGGAYSLITTSSSFVQSVDATGGVSADNSALTSNLLTAPGTSVFKNGQYDRTGTTAASSFPTPPQYMEFEFGLRFVSGVTNYDTYDFRVYFNGAVLDSYLVTPRIIYRTPTTIFLTTGTSWSVPADFDTNNNTIEAIGAGNDGTIGVTGTNWGGGGGGGAYARALNVNVSGSVAYRIGVRNGTAGSGIAPTANTYFADGSTLVAAGGAKPTVNDGRAGVGGSAGNSVGDIRFKGGEGGTGGGASGNGCGAGGGGAGRYGAGVDGGNDGAAGGAGDAGFGGAGGASGVPSGPATNGSNGTEIDASHGSGGGGGGGWSGSGAGGLYGAGGTGSDGAAATGQGKNGLIIISYLALSAIGFVDSPSTSDLVRSKPVPLALRTSETLGLYALPTPTPDYFAQTLAPQPFTPFVPVSLRTAYDVPQNVPVVAPPLNFLFSAFGDPLPRAPFVPPALRSALGWVDGGGALYPNAATPANRAEAGFDPLPRAHFVPPALREAFGWKVDLSPVPVPPFLATAGGDPLPRVRIIHPHLKMSFGASVGAAVLFPMASTPTVRASAGGDPLPFAYLQGGPSLKVRNSIFGSWITGLPIILHRPRKVIPNFDFVIMEEMVFNLNILITQINENLGLFGFTPYEFIVPASRINPDQLAEAMNRVVRDVNLRLKTGGLSDDQMILQFGQIDSSMCTLALNTFVDDLNIAFFYLFGV